MTDDEILATARSGFMDEARDMLRQFEQALLAMEQNPLDGEAVNGAFRAAHTIKGAAGLFGFDAVVGFTHEVESLLDAARSGTVALDEAAIGLLLQGRDQIERLLAEVDHGVADAGTKALSVRVGDQLRALHAVVPEAAAQPVWHLSLRLAPDALRNGLDPLPFIRYLGTLGRVLGIRTVSEAVPDLDSLDPEACHLGFEIRFASAADHAAIEQVFEFLRDDSDLALLAPEAGPAEYEQLLLRRAPDPVAREALLAHWQALAGPNQRPFIERRPQGNAGPPQVSLTPTGGGLGAARPWGRSEEAAERRQNEPERRHRDRRGGEETRFIRVRADKLDQLIDLIGELVIASSGAQLVAQQEQSARFAEATLRIHDLVQVARDGALGLRMVPIGETFTRFQRVVRDVCKQLGKDVELQISGGDTEMDKAMVDTIADPLTHLVRNSLDHGIEAPDARLAAGKPAQGRLALHAYHESGAIVIEVSDDGRGLNRDRILAKALERELIPVDAELSDDEIYQLIFLPGFSTAEKITKLSGRGVGMDVVKRNVEALRGQIRIASQPGLGATMQIRLPLTLAIIDGFLIGVGALSCVLPLELVAECLEVPPGQTQDHARDPSRISGHFDLRGEVVPYLDLARFYRQEPAPLGRRSLVLVRDGGGCVGLVVDRLLGEHQTVIKPLGPAFRQIRGLAGSTILGSGEVALILDVPALLSLATEQGGSRRPSQTA